MTTQLFDVPVILVHKQGEVTGYDSLGDPIYGPGRKEDAMGWIERSGSTEDLDHRDQVTSLYTLWLNGYVDLTAVDQVEYRGIVYEIEGKPGFQPGGFTLPSYTFANLRKVSG